MRLTWPEIRANAARFSEEWRGKGYEKGQTQSFYDEFFAIFGVPRKQVAVFEQRVRALDATRSNGFIDLFWPGTLIVEQKSAGRDLTRAMTQALDYYSWLPEAQRPRYMMVCDFQRFELVDLETRREWRFPLADLKRHVEAFGFIIGVQPRLFRNQSPVNRRASELMGRLHNALAADGYTGRPPCQCPGVRLKRALPTERCSVFLANSPLVRDRQISADIFKYTIPSSKSELGTITKMLPGSECRLKFHLAPGIWLPFGYSLSS